MEFASTKRIAPMFRSYRVERGFNDFDGPDEVIHVQATTYYASMQEIFIVCTAKEYATIMMPLSHFSSYNEHYQGICESIYNEMGLANHGFDIMGWNGREVLFIDMLWKLVSKEEVTDFLETMAIVVNQFKRKMDFDALGSQRKYNTYEHDTEEEYDACNDNDEYADPDQDNGYCSIESYVADAFNGDWAMYEANMDD